MRRITCPSSACTSPGRVCGKAIFGPQATYAAEAKQTAALLDDPASWGTALSASALVHAYDGSSALAREEVHEAVASFTAIDWPSGTIWPLWALGLTELSTGNPAAVDAALGPLADMVFAMGESDPVLSVFLPDEIEALVELGQLDRAEALIAWLESAALSSTAPGRLPLPRVAEDCSMPQEATRSVHWALLSMR